MNPNLAFLVGQVLGCMQRLEEGPVKTSIRPIMDKTGNYTNQLHITRESGTYILTIEPQGLTSSLSPDRPLTPLGWSK